MLGILVEKADAKRRFMAALGGERGTYHGEDYVITAMSGHLMEYPDPHEMVAPSKVEQYRVWNLDTLPWDYRDIQWKRRVKKGSESLVRQIGQVLSQCDEIVIATDVDPTGEGELLAWEVLDHLNLHHKKFSRMYFVDDTPVPLQKAFVDRKPITSMQDDGEYRKAEFRTRFDLLSMQFTRVASLAASAGCVLYQGRLKSAIVYLVGQQQAARDAWRRVPQYQNRFFDDHGVMYTNPDEPLFAAANQVPASYGPSAVVLDSRSMERTAPPKLLDLAGLSALLSSRGVKAKRMLDVYQKMYENRVVSYPRTDDKTITKEQFAELLPFVDQIAALVGADVTKLTKRTPRGTHVKDTGAHGANRPGTNVPASLQQLKDTYGPEAPLIYEVLAKNYLAMLAEDYVYEKQKGHIEKYPAFVGTANVPVSYGYREIFSADDIEKQQSGEELDENAHGLGQNATPKVHEIVPKQPVQPTMLWLMKQLAKHDVGTGATRTSTYGDVTSDKARFPLLSDQRGKITLTEYGQMSYRMLPGTHIGDISMTEYVYQEMRDIEKGTKNADDVLRVMADWVVEDQNVMLKNGASMRKELNVTEIVQREKVEATWNGEPVKFNRLWGKNDHWDGHRFTDEEIEKMLAGETISFPATSKAGKPYTASGKFGSGMFEGNKFYGFQLVFETIPAVFMGHTITPEEKAVLESGKKVFMDDLTSKAGNTFGADVFLGEFNGRPSLQMEFKK